MYAHSTSHRVRLSDVDHFEVMYFGNYLGLFEKGIIEMYRSAGMGWKWFEDNGVSFLVASASCDYRKPVRLDDMLEIKATAGKAGNSSLIYDIEIARTHRSGMHPDKEIARIAEGASAAGVVYGDGNADIAVDTVDGVCASCGADGAAGVTGGAEHEVVAVGKLVHVFIGPDERPDRLPDSIRARFDL